ncbi:MAG: hypothetical protein IJB19_04410 [Clostridia bacterium]|nr:hypothetical protein [Clostridia bacterium]
MTLYLQIIAVSGTSAEIFPVAVIDEFESAIWVRRYDTPGEFELYFAANKEIFKLVKENIGYLLVTREDRQDVMYVEYVKLTESAENGDRILLKGRSIDCVMGLRVIGYPTHFVYTPRSVVIERLINENMISPEPHTHYQLDTLHRTIAPFTFDRGTFTSSAIERSFNGENLLKAVGGLLKEGGYGLRNRLANGVIALELYKGQNRPNVKFSPDNENLLSSEYECDIRGQCNTVFVYAEGDEEHVKADGTNPYTVTGQYPAENVQKSNYMRYEGFMTGSADTTATVEESVAQWVQGRLIDGEPVASNYAVYCPDYIQSGEKVSVTWTLTSDTEHSWGYVQFYNARSEFTASTYIVNGDTITPPTSATKFRITLHRSIESTLAPSDVSSASYTALRDRPLAEYKAAVAEQGAALMNSKTDSISGETIETGLYKLGTDYDLGDTVRVENSYGVTGTAKVDAITEVEDAEGYRIYPTFTDWTVV